MAILREADRTSVAKAAKKHKVSEQTIYVLRKHFAGMASADVKRLKTLELENAKLKRLLAERDLTSLSTASFATERRVVSHPPAGRRSFIEVWRQHYNAVRPHSSLGY